VLVADELGNVRIAGMLEDAGELGFGPLSATCSALLVRLR
jgi:hypothetical protein